MMSPIGSIFGDWAATGAVWGAAATTAGRSDCAVRSSAAWRSRAVRRDPRSAPFGRCVATAFRSGSAGRAISAGSGAVGIAVEGTAAAIRGVGTAASAPVVSGADAWAGGFTQAAGATGAAAVTTGRKNFPDVLRLFPSFLRQGVAGKQPRL